LANSKTQNAFLFTVHVIFRHDYPLAVEPASTPRPLVQKKNFEEIIYLLIWSFLPCLSWLLRSRVRKLRRDLWITLYTLQLRYENQLANAVYEKKSPILFENPKKYIKAHCKKNIDFLFIVRSCGAKFNNDTLNF